MFPDRVAVYRALRKRNVCNHPVTGLSWNSQDFKGFSEGVSTPVRRVRLGSLSAPWIWMENALDEKHL